MVNEDAVQQDGDDHRVNVQEPEAAPQLAWRRDLVAHPHELAVVLVPRRLRGRLSRFGSQQRKTGTMSMENEEGGSVRCVGSCGSVSCASGSSSALSEIDR